MGSAVYSRRDAADGVRLVETDDIGFLPAYSSVNYPPDYEIKNEGSGRPDHDPNPEPAQQSRDDSPEVRGHHRKKVLQGPVNRQRQQQQRSKVERWEQSGREQDKGHHVPDIGSETPRANAHAIAANVQAAFGNSVAAPIDVAEHAHTISTDDCSSGRLSGSHWRLSARIRSPTVRRSGSRSSLYLRCSLSSPPEHSWSRILGIAPREAGLLVSIPA